jgi:hypothetical protein
LQKVQHDAEALGANADERNVELVAGRNVIDAAQYPAWNDGEAGCRGGLRQKFAPRKRGLKKAARPKAILHCSSLSTAINSDTLNEFEVCDAGNLIRFKKGLFSSSREQRRWDAKSAARKKETDKERFLAALGMTMLDWHHNSTREAEKAAVQAKDGHGMPYPYGNNQAGKNYKRQIRSSRS